MLSTSLLSLGALQIRLADALEADKRLPRAWWRVIAGADALLGARYGWPPPRALLWRCGGR